MEMNIVLSFSWFVFNIFSAKVLESRKHISIFLRRFFLPRLLFAFISRLDDVCNLEPDAYVSLNGKLKHGCM